MDTKYGKGKYQQIGTSRWFEKEIQGLEDRLDDPEYEMTEDDRMFLEVIKKLGKLGYQQGIKALSKEEYDYTLDMLKRAIDNGDLSIQDVSVIMGTSPTNISKLMSRFGKKFRNKIVKQRPILDPDDPEHPVKSSGQEQDPFPSTSHVVRPEDYNSIDERICDEFRKLIGDDEEPVT